MGKRSICSFSHREIKITRYYSPNLVKLDKSFLKYKISSKVERCLAHYGNLTPASVKPLSTILVVKLNASGVFM